MSELAELKSELRREMRIRRGGLSPLEQAEAAEHVADELGAVTQGITTFGVYDATDGELSLMPFVTRALARGCRVYFPRVTGSGKMVMCEVTDPVDELIVGKFGIREPLTAPADISEIECFLIPGVAFDNHGARIGFGGGYYDRMLAGIDPRASVLLVGVAYEWQILDRDIAVEPHDICVQFVATERRLLACRR